MKRIASLASDAKTNSQDQTGPASLSRRIFLRNGAYATAGLTLALTLPACSAPPAPAPQTVAAPIAPVPPPPAEFNANAFVRVTADNRIIITIKHLEMGQGAYNGLATLVAEEMDADWSQLEAHNAPADVARYNNLSWGQMQGTGGSSGLPNAFEQMREAGAAARYLLVSAAAEQWNVPRTELSVRQGRVIHTASNRSASFGELAGAASRQSLPASVELKDPKDFVFIGKPTPRLDVGKTNGTAQFTQDVNLPNMVTAVVAHPPRYGAVVTNVDSSAALAVPGVLAVLTVPSGVAVIGKTFWQAKQGRDALKVEWDESRAVFVDTAELLEQYHLKTTEPGNIAAKRGSQKKGFALPGRTLEASFEFPFLSHAPMEPMNCVVHQKSDGIEVWNGCQLQTVDQAAVAKVFAVEPSQVKINTLYAGGSFGRRANPVSDYVVEAAQIARAYERKVPVKLVWTREDDMRAGYFRPLYVHHLKA
ncbi:MAG TPA: molybdopterin cofactor-binding domain-containing protein, partial [Dongiaceae bacterium]|nr:molybdopterin cofactor-binding domain-containing protein [Dongiaceae bacterium]